MELAKMVSLPNKNVWKENGTYVGVCILDDCNGSIVFMEEHKGADWFMGTCDKCHTVYNVTSRQFNK